MFLTVLYMPYLLDSGRAQLVDAGTQLASFFVAGNLERERKREREREREWGG